MDREQIHMMEAFTYTEKHDRKIPRHHYQVLASWGIFTGETVKPFLLSSVARGQLYEDDFHQSNTAITSQIEILLTWLRDNGVLIPQPAQVRDYLSHFIDLTRIVRSVCKLAIDQFSGTAQLSLEVYGDPEIEDTYLVLYIRQSHYTEDILKSIKDLRAEYEVDLIDTSGWFLVTTDFRPPL
jgi:hypothetical protein